jgi:hypothetical protein
MDKFSRISNTKVNDLPKLIKSKEEMELEQLKFDLLKLMDSCLTIRSYGSARRNILQDTVKIAGKEMFIEALIDFMSNESLKEQIEVLESLKSNNKDWRSIDEKIQELNGEIQNIRYLNVNQNGVKKIKMFLENYVEDERFETLLENYVNKLNSGEEAYNTHLLVKEMAKNDKFSIYPKAKLQDISKQYLIRATQLGFNPNGTNINF